MTNPSLMVVVQRYGDVAGGGAEAHARALVQRLRPHFNIEVATTTARDYWTWANEFTAGLTVVDGVPVHRFAVERGRSRDFRLRERRAFSRTHTFADERAFVEAQGPVAPDLLEHVNRRAREIAFNTVEERAMVHRLFRNERVPNEVVGIGVDDPADRSAERFRQRYAIEGPYLLY